MMIIFGVLSGVYIIPTIYKDYDTLEHSMDVRGVDPPFVPSEVDKDIVRHSTPDVDSFAKNAVNKVRLKAKEIQRNKTVCNLVFLWYALHASYIVYFTFFRVFVAVAF